MRRTAQRLILTFTALSTLACAPEQVTIGSKKDNSGIKAPTEDPPPEDPPEKVVEDLGEELEGCYTNNIWYCNGDDLRFVRSLWDN